TPMARQLCLPSFVSLGLLIAAGYLAPLDAHNAETVWLSELDLSKAKVTENVRPAIDNTMGGKALTINKTTYDKGVCVNGPTVIYVNLNGGSDQFFAVLGVDDDAPPAPQAPAGTAGGRGGAGTRALSVRILADQGRLLYENT